MWLTDAGVDVLLISSTVYNEIPSEPTVIVVPVFDTDPDIGFGVDLGAGWAAPGLVTSIRKTRLRELRRRADIQALTDVNKLLLKILATPDRQARRSPLQQLRQVVMAVAPVGPEARQQRSRRRRADQRLRGDPPRDRKVPSRRLRGFWDNPRSYTEQWLSTGVDNSSLLTCTDAIFEHVAAFNAHDRERLLSGLHPGIVWSTGRDTLRGHAALAELFDDGLWAMSPSLRVLRLVTGTSVAAAELQESLTVDGEVQTFAIACFFDLDGPSIVRVKVFREGTADVG